MNFRCDPQLPILTFGELISFIVELWLRTSEILASSLLLLDSYKER
jgi:hypothetical protein